MTPARWLAADYFGEPFALFGRAHLVATCLVLLALLPVLLPRSCWSDRARNVFRFALAGALLALELGRHAWFLANGLWSVQGMLPLHFCTISVWLSVVALATRSRGAYEPLYFLGLGGATQALITPSLAPYGFPHVLALQTYASHTGIVMATLFLTRIEGFRPTPQSLLRLILAVAAYVPAVFALNLAIGSNYLFLAAKPEFATAMDWMPAWPWYIGVLIALALAIALLLYLPFLIADRRAATGIRPCIRDPFGHSHAP